ncbi:MAG: response regulator, partial [Rhodopila sp.]
MTVDAGPLRVLVVDDEPAIRRFLRAGLSSQGYIVTELETGLPAVDAARRGATDLIVLDLGLP